MRDEKLEKASRERRAVRLCLSLLAENDDAKILITTRPHHCKELQVALSKAIVAHIHGDLKI